MRSIVAIACCTVLWGVACGSTIAAEDGKTMTYRHFKVVEEDGKVAAAEPVLADPVPRWAQDVSQEPWDWSNGPDTNTPYFVGPIPFVIEPKEGANEPFYSHNHCPSIVWLDNGDLLAIWYSTQKEDGTELTILAGRKRAGRKTWDPSSEFFKAENRNMHGSSLFRDATGRLGHINGMGAAGVTGWAMLALLLRTSDDNGVTWTPPQAMGADYRNRHQPIAGAFLTRDGTMIQACDAVPGGNGGAALLISADGGLTWVDPGEGKPAPTFQAGTAGEGTIAGIHAGVVELKDGRLMALGRGDSINGRMPMSLSGDRGKTWTYSAGPFPPIGGGQRLTLKRLREGPILLISFTNSKREDTLTSWTFTDAEGNPFDGVGLYAALSFDEGASWPVRKLLTPGKGDFDGGAWTGPFTATPTRAEHAGYLAAAQTPDGVIHLISSRLHYQFNLKWLQTPTSLSQ